MNYDEIVGFNVGFFMSYLDNSSVIDGRKSLRVRGVRGVRGAKWLFRRSQKLHDLCPRCP